MKKKRIFKEFVIVLSLVMGLNLFVLSAGFAKDDDESEHSSHKSEHASEVKSEKSEKPEKSEKAEKPEKAEKSESTHGSDSVTKHTYGKTDDDHGKRVPRGLMIAYIKSEGKSAQSVIGDLLLSKYSVTEIIYSLLESLKGKLNVTGVVYGSTAVTDGVYGKITVVGSTYGVTNNVYGTGSVTGNVYGDDDSVTGSVYGNEGSVTDSVYEVDDETKDMIKHYAEELHKHLKDGSQQIDNQAAVLSQLAELYNIIGNADHAIDALKDAVKSDRLNLEGYKKLAKLIDKKGGHGIKGFVNGDQLQFDVEPVIKNDRTLVPFRAISEALKADVQWDEATQTVTVTKNGVEVKLTIGSNVALVNGQEVQLDTPAEVIKDRTVIPVRFISEAFKANVQWDDETQSVVVNEIQ